MRASEVASLKLDRKLTVLLGRLADGTERREHPSRWSHDPQKTAECIVCDAVIHGSRIDGANDGLRGADKRFPSTKLQWTFRLLDHG